MQDRRLAPQRGQNRYLRRAGFLLSCLLFCLLAWMRWKPIPERSIPPGAEVHQWSVNTCGPAAAASLLNVYGRAWSKSDLERESNLTPVGCSLFDLRDVLRRHGLLAEGFHAVKPAGLLRIPRPFIAHLARGHFVVVERLRRGRFEVFDPASGDIRFWTPEELYPRGGGWAVSAQ